jgi:uncharacterized protein
MLGAWIAFGLVAGLVGGALVLGDGVKKIRRGDRYVTVKGLVERDVTADLAVWPLKFKASGDDLGTTQAALEASKQKVLAFLKAGGIDDQSIELRGVRVVFLTVVRP